MGWHTVEAPLISELIHVLMLERGRGWCLKWELNPDQGKGARLRMEGEGAVLEVELLLAERELELELELLPGGSDDWDEESALIELLHFAGFGFVLHATHQSA